MTEADENMSHGAAPTDDAESAYNELFERVIAAHGEQMRLNADGTLGGFYNPPVKPVLRAVRKILDDAGVAGTPKNVTGSDAYDKIGSLILDLPQQQARELGLQNILPPPHVHMMARQKGLFFDFRNSDIIAGAASDAAHEIRARGHYLDFGCSSGRTVRTLDLAFPNAFWHGVDPVSESIQFARMMLPQAEFRVSHQSPPLAYAPETFDGIVALSIWSHFSAEAGKIWLEEMRRIVRPGGFLLFTSHGFTDIATKIRNRKAPVAVFVELMAAMERDGYYFQNDIREGHRGLETQSWGTTYMSREWIIQNYLSAGWELAHWAPGQWGNRQDVNVLTAV